MWENFFSAFALMLVFEGILPFLNPGRWRRLMASAIVMPNKVIRILGLVSMVIGVSLLYLVHHVVS